MIDFENFIIMGCRPLSHQPNAPKDHSPSTIEDCSICCKPMWVSEKKKNKLKEPNTYVYCYICIIKEVKEQNIELKLFDINKIQ